MYKSYLTIFNLIIIEIIALNFRFYHSYAYAVTPKFINKNNCFNELYKSKKQSIKTPLLIMSNSSLESSSQQNQTLIVSDITAIETNSDPLNLPDNVEALVPSKNYSLTLIEALEIARQNNLDIQKAKQELTKAEANIGVARAAYFPSLTAELVYEQYLEADSVLEQRVDEDLRFPVSPISAPYDRFTYEWTGELSLTYDIYAGGERAANFTLASQQSELAASTLAQQTLSTDYTTANAYFDLQLAQEEANIANESVKNASISLSDTDALRKAGAATLPDVLQAEVNLANAQQDLLKTFNKLDVARSKLAETLNLSATVNLNAKDPLKAIGKWELSLEESIILAWEKRPELEQQLLNRDIAISEREVAISALRPTLSIEAELNTLDNLGAGNAQTLLISSEGIGVGYTLEASLTIPIIDGGKAISNARKAEADQAIAETEFAQARNQILQQVREAYSNFQQNQSALQIAYLAVEKAEKTLQLKRIQFQAGFASQTDIIASEDALNRSRLNLVEAIIGYNQAIVNLKQATYTVPKFEPTNEE